MYGYDSTTCTRGTARGRGQGSSRQNPNDEGTITYPFSRDRPNIEALQAMAQYGGINEYVDLGAPGASLNWDALYGSSPDDRVVFVHAHGSDLRLDFCQPRSSGHAGRALR